MVATLACAQEGVVLKARNVRFGSKADMCSAKRHVRFTPNSDHESGHVPMVVSALPPKADILQFARNFAKKLKAEVAE
jgi:hypothetical protein